MSDTTTPEATTSRLDVQSRDGPPLAVWVDGEGPAVVLVHGCPSEHSTFHPLVQELRPHVTTYAMDRRGSGASGDTAPYAIEREFEDVAAVVDAAAARTGGPLPSGATATDATRPWAPLHSPATCTTSSFMNPASA